MLTGVVVWHHDGLRFKVRVTADASGGEDIWEEVDRLIRAFAITQEGA